MPKKSECPIINALKAIHEIITREETQDDYALAI